MKREDKAMHSRKKIMDAAFKEFGERSYGEASLNTICKEGDISKGIIYHYFKDKDALFLACVQECFDALTVHLKEHGIGDLGKKEEIGEKEEIGAVLHTYFEARMDFFNRYPGYLKVYYSAVIMPPPHLAEAVAEIRTDFDSMNISFLTGILKRVPLRKGIGMDEVIDVFRVYQDIVNTHDQMEAAREMDIRKYEKKRSRMLEILLYGVIERG